MRFLNLFREFHLRSSTYHYKNGLKDFIKYLTDGSTTLYKEPIYIEGKSDLVSLNLAIQAPLALLIISARTFLFAFCSANLISPS